MIGPDGFQAPACWADLRIGARAETPIVVRARDMQAFTELSGDSSPVHTDAGFAERGGYRGVIVYGGLLVAALSRMVGMTLPGPIGVATGWRIDFHSPLYVDEGAVLSAEISQLSEATRVARLRFTISSGSRLIAKGSAEAKIIA